MPKPIREALFGLTTLLAWGILWAADSPVSPGPIDARRVSDIVRTLASDDFQGRAPGTAGEAKTLAYLTTQFRNLGLEPAGEKGGWAQTVPLLRTQVGTPKVLSFSHAGTRNELKQGGEIYFSTLRDTTRVVIENAPLVFVGYGVAAPERQWDDFKGSDLRGKVAVFLVNDPDFSAADTEPVAGKFGGRRMTYYGRWTYKYEEATRRGALAALIVHDTEGAGYGWSTVIAPGGENYDLSRTSGPQPLLLQGWIEGAAATALFKNAGLDLAALRAQARKADFKPVELKGATFSVDAPVTATKVQSHNVLAKIAGSEHPDETIMFAAHWDAYGVGAPNAQGDTIRHGAADDALGVAGVLELARAFKGGAKPKRTLVFAAWTAEERGLIGSRAYATSPLFPLSKTVANFTLDILQTAGPARDVLLVGVGQTSLEDDLAKAAQGQGRVVTPEALPERGLFYRADHFSLAQKGVPVLLLMAISGSTDLVSGGREAGERWLANYMSCYHQPCDAWSANWDLRGAARDVDLIYSMGSDLAGSRRWPEWRKESEFAAVRAASRAERR
jgi:Zn-dependent M28 family amino/carboxypeptidase